MKQIFLFLFIACNLLGNILEIQENFKSESALFHTQYIETNSSNIDEIVKITSFKNLNKQNLGYFSQSNIWTKLTIANVSHSTMTLIAYNPKAGMDIVNMYLLRDDKMSSIHHMGDNQLFSNRILKGRHSAIEITLLPYETIELFTMLKNKGSVFAEIVLTEKNTFFQQESYELIVLTILSTILFILSIYLFILSRILKQKVFYIYIIHLMSMVLFFASSNGLIFFLSEGSLSWLQEFMNYFGIIIALGCLWCFHIILFNLYTISPIVYKTTLILIVLLAAVTLLVFLQQHISVLQNVSLLLPLVNIISYLYSFFILIYILVKKLPYGIYYFLGHLLYYTSLFIYHEVLLGNITETFITIHIGIIGVILEAMTVTYIMKHMIQQSLKEKKHIEKLLLAHSQFFSVGKELATIIHQWKVPLHRISSILTYLESLVFKKSVSLESLEKSLIEMRNSILFMDDTISSFYEFYKKEQRSKTFNVVEYIDKLIDMFRPLLESNQIKIYNQCSKELTLHLKINIFGHVLLILIQNAVESLCEVDSEIRSITIKSDIVKEKLILSIIDTGKGLNPTEMRYLFSERLNSNKGLGFGLYLASFLVQNELNGKIVAENLNNGAAFKLLL